MAVMKMDPTSVHIVQVEKSLRTPFARSLRHDVRERLRRGERRIVLDMSGVSTIDAAGIGELIRTMNMTAAVNGVLRIANVTRWVRELLEQAHLFDLLRGEGDVRQRLA